METAGTDVPRRGFSGTQVVLIVLAAIVIAVVATLWIARAWLFPSDFKPVELSQAEAQQLDRKLQALERAAIPDRSAPAETDEEWLRPEPYSEANATREIELSERELNGIIGRDPDLARRLAVDLSNDLASARLLVPLDPELPLFGGRTLRVNAGLEIRHQEGQLAVRLRGVSLMGVPLPNAWLGNLKNVDLVAEFGSNPGFWRSLAAGFETIRIADGSVQIRLRE